MSTDTYPHSPWWETDKEPESRICEICGANGPLFHGHDIETGQTIMRCEDMKACRERTKR